MPGRAPAGFGRPHRQRRGLALALLSATTAAACSQPTAQPPDGQPETGTATGSARTAPTTAPAPGGNGSVTTIPPSLGPADAVRTVVLGDDGTASPVGGAPVWPELLGATLERIGIPMSVVTAAADEAGFASSPSFTDLVAQHAVGSTQLVVLFDSRLGEADPAALAAAATESAEAVERAAPDAELVVVGPLPAGDLADGPATALREAVQDAGGTFIDPALEGWPPDATQAEIADLLRLHVQPIAEGLAASGANR